MKRSSLFSRLLHIPYTHLEGGASYALERVSRTLYIYFEGSNGDLDWKNNLDFPVKPYKRMGNTVWHAHRGFLRVWKSVRDVIAPYLLDPAIDRAVTVGYSHGGALAAFCHEHLWFCRPDLRERIEGYGFGAPRVYFGCMPREVALRWARFEVVRNTDDIVTHLPPTWILYRHVGQLLVIGEKGRYGKIDAHRAENILASLREYEQKTKNSEKMRFF